MSASNGILADSTHAKGILDLDQGYYRGINKKRRILSQSILYYGVRQEMSNLTVKGYNGEVWLFVVSDITVEPNVFVTQDCVASMVTILSW